MENIYGEFIDKEANIYKYTVEGDNIEFSINDSKFSGLHNVAKKITSLMGSIYNKDEELMTFLQSVYIESLIGCGIYNNITSFIDCLYDYRKENNIDIATFDLVEASYINKNNKYTHTYHINDQILMVIVQMDGTILYNKFSDYHKASEYPLFSTAIFVFSKNAKANITIYDLREILKNDGIDTLEIYTLLSKINSVSIQARMEYDGSELKQIKI